MKMKIFELRWTETDEKDWIAANTNIQAIKTYLSVTSQDITDLDDMDEIVELPEDEWDKMSIQNSEYDETDPDDFEEQSFAEYMKHCTTPDLIASTIYPL